MMAYTAILWTDIFWISYIKWYKPYSNNLSIVLGSKQAGGGGGGGVLKLVKPKHKDWASIQFADSLCSELSCVLCWDVKLFFNKTSKRKVRKYLKCVKEFSRRFDLANGSFVIDVLKIKQILVSITVNLIIILYFYREEHLHLNWIILY